MVLQLQHDFCSVFWTKIGKLLPSFGIDPILELATVRKTKTCISFNLLSNFKEYFGTILEPNWDFATYFGKPPRPGNNRGIDPVLELDTVHEGLLVGRRDDFSDTLTKHSMSFHEKTI